MTRPGIWKFKMRIVALLVYLASIVCIGIYSNTTDAVAQNVRPPANATKNEIPQNSRAKGDVPSRATRPTNITEGKVPGKSLGNRSNAELWRSVKNGVVGKVSIQDQKAGQLVQTKGELWRSLKNGPIAKYGTWAMLASIVLVGLFFLLRGRIRIDHGFSSATITRFGFIERLSHWLLATSFIILAVTGLNISYGKYFIPMLIGKANFASMTLYGKWVHDYVAFAFMVSLVLILVIWIKHNFPNRYDFIWLLKGGGMFKKGSHPPAKKFNAGQKILFWLIILGGASLSLSGISLLLPFQTAIFAKTFEVVNIFGFNLPTDLTPVAEMQLATLWHSVVALALICVVVAHIYIGSLGMEGAFDAMGSGEVDRNWAKEHHSVWYAEEMEHQKQLKNADESIAKAQPAE